MSKIDYKAFITYSHADTKVASWLQRALESYRVPSRLIGKKSSQGEITRRLGSIFRDRDELSAGGDLSQTLNDALAKSEFLIVVCSPEARKSRWVGLEINEFKRTHPGNKILCLLAGGEPFAGNNPEQMHLECFPKTLGYLDFDLESQVASEPIAADVREGGDGKRLAKLKIISGLLGVGLDELIQRDAQRRQRNLLVLTLTSALGMLAFATLSFVAVDARNSEELRRAEAEELIEFMLSDLRDRLEAVGRLDVLDAVGEKAIEYYSNVALAEHSESSLGRRARAFHLLGEVDDLKGDMESAREAFDEAFQSTGELLARDPENGDRIYNHSQSIFWVGYLDWRLGDYERAGSAWQEYLSLANELPRIDPDNLDWFVEAGHANINMGVYTLDVGQSEDAIPYFNEALTIFEEASRRDPQDAEWSRMLAQANAWLADVNLSIGLLSKAIDYRSSEAQIYEEILGQDIVDQQVNSNLMISYLGLGEIYFNLGDLPIALETLFQAKNQADKLIELDPSNTFYISQTASVYSTLGEALSFSENTDQSLELISSAEILMAGLMERDGDIAEWNTSWIRIRIKNAKILLRNHEPDGAIIQLTEIIEELDQLVTSNPGASTSRNMLAEAYFFLGKASDLIGDTTSAGRNYELAVEYFSSFRNDLSPRMMAVLTLALGELNNTVEKAEIAEELRRMNFNHPEYLYYN